jgi:hypothetical protein
VWKEEPHTSGANCLGRLSMETVKKAMDKDDPYLKLPYEDATIEKVKAVVEPKL